MAAPGRVDEVFEHIPASCECGHRFDGSEERVAEPLVHQLTELPPVTPLIFEHRMHRLLCPGCTRVIAAELPAGTGPSAFGPRLQAHVAVLAGVHRLSRREVKAVIGEMFGIDISLGSVDATIMRISALLADPWAELREAVRQAELIWADETSWRLAGATQWIWLAASSLCACFQIDPSRARRVATELLGSDFGGIAHTDRYAAYHFLDVLQQQICWSHAQRQFAEIAGRPGAAGVLGAKLVKAAKEVFTAHRAYCDQGRDLAWLRAELAPVRERVGVLLEQGTRGRDERTARFCAGLIAESDALWTFCEVEGAEPTNNRAERAVRHGVLLRKTQLGTQSDRGSRWIERICSVRESCRLQGRSVLEFMIEVAEAAHGGGPPPSLVPP
jgi:transposase